MAALPLGTSADAPLATLNVGAIPIAGAAEAFFAQERGTFKAAGLDVHIAGVGGGSQLIAAAMSGAVDIGFSSPSAMIQARAKGLPVRYVQYAEIYPGPPPSSTLMISKAGPIKTAADLNGKRIAVNALSNIGQYEVQAWIDKNGGNASTVQFVELPYAEMFVALEQGRVAAASETEPWSDIQNGTARVLGDLNAVVGPRYVLAGWFSTDGWLQKNPDLAKRFAAVIQDSARWANAHPKDAAALLVRYLNVTPDVALLGVKRLTFDENPHPDAKDIQPVIDLIAKYGKVPALSASDLVWAP